MEKKYIKIALMAMSHNSMGMHTFYMPLGLGMIAEYTKKILPEINFDFRLYITPDSFLDDFRTWKPDIVGGSFFTWNHRVNLFIMKKVKEHFPKTLTVLGGPDFYNDEKRLKDFFMKNPFIDFGVYVEGEKPFSEIVKYFSDNSLNEKKKDIKGIAYLDDDGNTLAWNEPCERIESLDEIPSPYLSGFFDKLFEDNLHPLIQTTRGCPFTCGFCRMSMKTHSKIARLSLERVEKDLQYCAERLRNKHGVHLFIVDSNFGMFERDIQVAQLIRNCQEEYDWPRYLSLATGKNKKENVIKTTETLKWGLPVTMSAQSLHPDTLQQIKRSNISLDVMKETILYAQKNNIYNYGELIANLPDETTESFENGIKTMMDLNVGEIMIMQFMLLKGIPVAEEKIISDCEYEIRYRIIPRCYGEYEGNKIVEIEAIVVGTKTMPFKDYFYFRELEYVIYTIYNSEMFYLLRRYLIEIDLDRWSWVKAVYEKLKTSSGKASEQMGEFANEARQELYNSPEEIYGLINDDSFYSKLLKGELGDNLINKYRQIALSDGLHDWLGIACDTAYELFKIKGNDDQKILDALNCIKKYSLDKYDISKYFDELPHEGEKSTINFDFDIKRWENDRGLRLSDCLEKTTYEQWFDGDQIFKIRNILDSGHEKIQTRQFVFRDRKYHSFIPHYTKTD